jgi:hypothetical protein
VLIPSPVSPKEFCPFRGKGVTPTAEEELGARSTEYKKERESEFGHSAFVRIHQNSWTMLFATSVGIHQNSWIMMQEFTRIPGLCCLQLL